MRTYIAELSCTIEIPAENKEEAMIKFKQAFSQIPYKISIDYYNYKSQDEEE